MCKNWASKMLSVGALLSIVLAAATVSLAGKPGGGGGTPTPPPVLYHLTWLGTLGGVGSAPGDINNQGEVVGWAHASDGRRRAFVYTTQTGMVDLNAVAPLPDGWVARNARGINELGQIVGDATNDDVEGTRAFFYYPTVQPPQSMLLPTFG